MFSHEVRTGGFEFLRQACLSLYTEKDVPRTKKLTYLRQNGVKQLQGLRHFLNAPSCFEQNRIKKSERGLGGKDLGAPHGSCLKKG